MVRAAVHLYTRLGLPGIGLIFFLEGIGVPIPIEIPLWMVGSRMSRGVNTYWEIMLLMWLTTFLGNTAGYGLGYYGGRPLALRLLRWFRIRHEVWDRIELWFRRHGLKVVVAIRWINWGTAQNMWLCGITRVPFGRFLAVVAINDFLWAMAWTRLVQTAMTLVRRSWDRFLESAMRMEIAALALIGIALGIWALIWWLRRRKP